MQFGSWSETMKQRSNITIGDYNWCAQLILSLPPPEHTYFIQSGHGAPMALMTRLTSSRIMIPVRWVARVPRRLCSARRPGVPTTMMGWWMRKASSWTAVNTCVQQRGQPRESFGCRSRRGGGGKFHAGNVMMIAIRRCQLRLMLLMRIRMISMRMRIATAYLMMPIIPHKWRNNCGIGDNGGIGSNDIKNDHSPERRRS